MSYFENAGVWVFGIIASVATLISGHVDQAVQLLVALMVIDIISGLLKGAKQKRLKSAIMHMGILKKTGILLALVTATVLDYAINDGVPVFRTLMVWVAVAMEGLSILENLTALGVYIPDQIKDRLGQVIKQAEQIQTEKDLPRQ